MNKKHFILRMMIAVIGVTAVFLVGRALFQGEDKASKTIATPVQLVSKEAEEIVDLESNSTPVAPDTIGNQADIPIETVEVISDENSKDEIVKEKIFRAEELADEVIGKITGISYKQGESLPIEELRLLTLTYIDYQGETQYGEMIVNEKVSQDVMDIFSELYDAKFPIDKMKLVDDYQADDELSMKDNNTSAYNHRVIAGTNRLSNHAKGLAVDINPLYNPYIAGGRVLPAEGADYVVRAMSSKSIGMIFKGDVCYNAFIKRGWSWGGEWQYSKDYQHFEKVD